MSTARQHNAMLKEKLTNKLMWKEQIRRNYALSQLEKRKRIDMSWRGGPIAVPFMSHAATNIKVGGIVPQASIGHSKHVRGEITSVKEIWAALKFYDRDLIEHDGKYSEASFLDNLLGQVKSMEEWMKDMFSICIFNDGSITKLRTGGNSATGNITVDHPERLQNEQEIEIDDGTNTVTGFCKGININSGALQVVTTRGGSTGVDLSAEAFAAGTKIYLPGGADNGFTTIPSQLLSAAAGGPANIFGVVKTDSPFTQALNVDGAGITTTNCLEALFDIWALYHKKTKNGNADIICSTNFAGGVLKKLENASGPYKHLGTKVNAFGYKEIFISGFDGDLKLVVVNEKDDDSMMILDWDTFKFNTYEGFKRHETINGNLFYEVRDDTDGYIYITDVKMYGDIACEAPWKNLIVHDVPTFSTVV